MIQAFPGKQTESKQLVDISKLFEVRYADYMSSLYKKVDVYDNNDVAVDASGYTGIFFR